MARQDLPDQQCSPSRNLVSTFRVDEALGQPSNDIGSFRANSTRAGQFSPAARLIEVSHHMGIGPFGVAGIMLKWGRGIVRD